MSVADSPRNNPQEEDHGKTLYRHSKHGPASANRYARGKPHGSGGLPSEHAERYTPEIPWARQGREKHFKSGQLGPDATTVPVAGEVTPTGHMSTALPPVPPGMSLLGTPDLAPPKREVRLNEHHHHEEDPEHRAKARDGLSGKLKSEMRADDLKHGRHHSGYVKRDGEK